MNPCTDANQKFPTPEKGFVWSLGDSVEWELQPDGTVTVSYKGSYYMAFGDPDPKIDSMTILFPARINGHPVTKIGEGWLGIYDSDYPWDSIVSHVWIPPTVTSIDSAMLMQRVECVAETVYDDYFYESQYFYEKNVHIYGQRGSYAEVFAKEHRIFFTEGFPPDMSEIITKVHSMKYNELVYPYTYL